MKTNIASISDGMSIIRQLTPRSFKFDTSYHYLSLPTGKQYGLIAQEVEPVLPEV